MEENKNGKRYVQSSLQAFWRCRSYYGGPLTATVDVVELLGHELHVYLDTGHENLVATVDTRLAPTVGQALDLVVDVDPVHLFDKTTEKAIR